MSSSSSARFVDVFAHPDVARYLATLVHTGEVRVPDYRRPSSADTEEGDVPSVVVMDRRVLCNGASLDLARRPMMLRVFQAFCDARGGRLTREDLLPRLYGIGASDGLSERYREALCQNGVKMISRTRAEAQATLGRAAGPGVDWMRYDSEARAWDLLVARRAPCPEGKPHLRQVNEA